MSYTRPRLFLLFLILSVAAGSMPVPAKADSILNVWFPQIFGPPETGPRPQDTLIAPFAQDQTGKTRSLSDQERKDLNSPENIVPITQPHRSNKYIGDWASLITSESLTFDSDKVEDHLKALDKDFVPAAKQEFMDYLTRSKTLEGMKARRERIQAYTGTVPTLLNEGEFAGSYRWLYDVPVITTQLPNSARGYSGKVKPQTFTQNLIIRLQIGRAKTGFKEGMAIEHWSVVGAPTP